MENKKLIETLNSIFCEVLDNDGIKLTEATTANDVEEWDSLTHIQLIVAIEKRLKIRFASREIQSWKNVGEMLETINTKLQNTVG